MSASLTCFLSRPPFTGATFTQRPDRTYVCDAITPGNKLSLYKSCITVWSDGRSYSDGKAVMVFVLKKQIARVTRVNRASGIGRGWTRHSNRSGVLDRLLRRSLRHAGGDDARENRPPEGRWHAAEVPRSVNFSLENGLPPPPLTYPHVLIYARVSKSHESALACSHRVILLQHSHALHA